MVAGACVVALGAGVSVAALVRARDADTDPGAAGVPVAARGAFDDAARIVFRSTAPGDLYGRVAVVALDDPAGPRDVTPVACDRVDAVPGRESCLRTERGTTTSFIAEIFDARWRTIASWPLAGVPSRTRLSDDGTKVGVTSFVTGHAYGTTGVSTETTIHALDALPTGEPTDLGNLEDWMLLVDGTVRKPADRNLWGVTFVDDTHFYATAQSHELGHTWLVMGNTAARTLTTVADQVECPSISPDGTRIAFKRDVVDGPGIHWTPAIYDIASGKVTVLDAEKRTIDDQIEWLDDAAILYGMPREDEPGVSDVWQLPADGSGAPSVLVPEAWSPAVVR
jgi:hypothetical protein